MDSMHEIIPFAREMLLMSQRPGRGMLKVYLVGSVFAVLGTVIGLVETVCYPFTSGGEPLDADMLLLVSRREREREQRVVTLDTDKKSPVVVAPVAAATKEEEDEATDDDVTAVKAQDEGPQQSYRSPVNRMHASCK